MKNLLLFAALLVISTGAIAETETGLIDPQQEYTVIGTTDDGSVTTYVALSGKAAPIEISPGVVLYWELSVSNTAVEDFPTGSKLEVLNLVDCNKQVYKAVGVASQSPGYTINYYYTGDALKIQGESEVDLDKEPWETVPRGTVAAAVSDAVCKYVKDHKS